MGPEGSVHQQSDTRRQPRFARARWRLALDALAGQLAYLFHPSLGLILEVDSCVNVCWRLQVWVHQHRYDADPHAVDADNRPPPLVCCLLLVEAVRAWGMEYRDTDTPIRVDVWVPHLGLKTHLWWVVRIVTGEGQEGAKYAPFIEAVGGTLKHHAPLEKVRVIFKAH